MIFPYNSLYTQSCRIHHVFGAWKLVLRIQNGGLTTQTYTARHGETLRVFLDLAHFWPEFYLQIGTSFSISFTFMFFFFIIRDDPSRSELIRPRLAVRVDPVRLLYLPIYFLCLHLHCCLTWTERIVNTPFSATIASMCIASSILQAQWPVVFVPHVAL